MIASETHATPALLALDWGTATLRAFLLGDEGVVLHARTTPHGLQALPAAGIAGFEQALTVIAADWLDNWPQLPVVASGMVGSAHGWREAPYVRCPADVGALAAHSVHVISSTGTRIDIAPGVLLDEAGLIPDVMRGEEIQIAGAIAQNSELGARATLLLPGTHAKWVSVEDGRITRFATYITGELFAVLREHSLLSRLMSANDAPAPAAARAAFVDGVHAARASLPGDFARLLFSARTLGLTRRLHNDVLQDYLSGLLIGFEIVSGLARSAIPPLLVGERALCERYALAFDACGVAVSGIIDDPAPRGMWEFARALGVLGTAAAP